MDNKLSSKIKKTGYYILMVFLTLTLIYTTFSVFFQLRINTIKKDEIVSNQEKTVQTKIEFVIYKLNRLIGDALYITDTFMISNADAGDYSEIINEWLSFSNRMNIYDQIRYIGIDGYEKIRIQHDDNGSFLVNNDELQYKGDYYYFINTIKLNAKQVYFSKMDLNVENKIIEEPKKPMLRIATPLYIDHELCGIIILNYYGNDILNYIDVKSKSNQNSIYMLDSNGYWIVNSEDSSLEWGFLYEDKANDTFASLYPNEWATIKQENKGTIITENGVFSFANMYTNEQFGLLDTDTSLNFETRDYYIVNYLPIDAADWIYFETNIFVILAYTVNNNLLNYGILLFISIVISIMYVVYREERDKIKYYSTFDVMTGVYNRRTGLDKLNSIYKKYGNNTKSTTVCFIDINGLKEVNDELGHIIGDELIMNVVKVIKENIRNNDFISRFGGDEFLIVLTNINAEEAEFVWTRINNEFNRINREQDNPYNISVSHGIYEFTANENETLDSLINKADAKMYEEKRHIKKGEIIIKK